MVYGRYPPTPADSKGERVREERLKGLEAATPVKTIVFLRLHQER
jgi:hypothetical protein